MTENEFVNRVRTAGARVFIVGGWVRDFLRQVPAHDKDYMVAGIDEETFQQVFPHALRVGKAFPVYLVDIDGCHAEVAFARKEEKQGAGYRGFAVEYGRNVTLEEDLSRRDTTINSMAMELPSGEIFDFYGGREDVKQGIIRPVSHHFAEDPVRALRAARQAAEFHFTLAEETKEAMAACREELAGEPAERLLQELKRALLTEKPSLFFRALQETGLLAVTFPELAALIGKTQPEAFHPEGDAFAHTMLVVDTVAAETDSLLARFCGLVHDLGKGETPAEMLPAPHPPSLSSGQGHIPGRMCQDRQVCRQYPTVPTAPTAPAETVPPDGILCGRHPGHFPEKSRIFIRGKLKTADLNFRVVIANYLVKGKSANEIVQRILVFITAGFSFRKCLCRFSDLIAV